MSLAPVVTDAMADLLERVTATPREDLRELLRALDLAREAVILRLLQPSTAARWLTVLEAADLAQVRQHRIRAWARRPDATWASRPTRKTLRIHEERFREWLARGPDESPRTHTKRADPSAPQVRNVHSAHESAPKAAGLRLRTVMR